MSNANNAGPWVSKPLYALHIHTLTDVISKMSEYKHNLWSVIGLSDDAAAIAVAALTQSRGS